MKRFLFRLTLFFITLAVICIIPCWIFEKKAKECTDIAPFSRFNMVVNSFNADVVVLGNSRAELSYNDSLLSALTGKKCLNLGVSGYPFDFQYNVMYKRYLLHNEKPHTIIVEVGPVAFFKHTVNPYTIELLPYVNDDDYRAYIDLCPELTIADKIMFVRYFGKLDLVMKTVNKFEKHTKKNNLRTTDWEKENDSIKYGLECDTAIVHLFCDFIDECKEQETEVLLVCSPIHADFGSRLYDMDNFWKIIKYCTRGKRMPIISYQDFFGSDKRYFADPMHLNKYGKDCFSIQLAHDLDSLGLLK